MRAHSLIYLIILSSILSSCELITSSKHEKPAEFPGGREGLVDYLRQNIQVPAIAEELGISGKVYARFVIDASGRVSYVHIIKGIDKCPECSEEVLRVISKMPRWKPASNNGRKLNSWYKLPIVFNIQ